MSGDLLECVVCGCMGPTMDCLTVATIVHLSSD